MSPPLPPQKISGGLHQCQVYKATRETFIFLSRGHKINSTMMHMTELISSLVWQCCAGFRGSDPSGHLDLKWLAVETCQKIPLLKLLRADSETLASGWIWTSPLPKERLSPEELKMVKAKNSRKRAPPLPRTSTSAPPQSLCTILHFKPNRVESCYSFIGYHQQYSFKSHFVMLLASIMLHVCNMHVTALK